MKVTGVDEEFEQQVAVACEKEVELAMKGMQVEVQRMSDQLDIIEKHSMHMPEVRVTASYISIKSNIEVFSKCVGK